MTTERDSARCVEAELRVRARLLQVVQRVARVALCVAACLRSSNRNLAGPSPCLVFVGTEYRRRGSRPRDGAHRDGALVVLLYYWSERASTVGSLGLVEQIAPLHVTQRLGARWCPDGYVAAYLLSDRALGRRFVHRCVRSRRAFGLSSSIKIIATLAPRCDVHGARRARAGGC